MRKFVGVDLASATMGLVVLDEHASILHASRSNTSKLVNKMSMWDRYFKLLDTFVEVVTPIRDDIEMIFVEGYGGAHHGTLIKAVECGTILRMLSVQLDLYSRITVVPPTTLKKFTTGKGNAPKDVMIAKVFQKYGWMAPDNDQADAYALATMGLKIYFDEMLSYERDAIAKLEVSRN